MEAGCDSHARPLLCFTAGPADATGKDSGKAPAPAAGPDAGDQSEYLPVPLPRGARGACSPADYRGSGQDLRHAGRFCSGYVLSLCWKERPRVGRGRFFRPVLPGDPSGLQLGNRNEKEK